MTDNEEFWDNASKMEKAHFHDTVADATRAPALTDTELLTRFGLLSEELQYTAFDEGLSDTVVRDAVHGYFSSLSLRVTDVVTYGPEHELYGSLQLTIGDEDFDIRMNATQMFVNSYGIGREAVKALIDISLNTAIFDTDVNVPDSEAATETIENRKLYAKAYLADEPSPSPQHLELELLRARVATLERENTQLRHRTEIIGPTMPTGLKSILEQLEKGHE